MAGEVVGDGREPVRVSSVNDQPVSVCRGAIGQGPAKAVGRSGDQNRAQVLKGSRMQLSPTVVGRAGRHEAGARPAGRLTCAARVEACD